MSTWPYVGNKKVYKNKVNKLVFEQIPSEFLHREPKFGQILDDTFLSFF